MKFLTYVTSADPGLTTANYHKVQDRQAVLETILKLISVKTCLKFSVTCIQPPSILCHTLVNGAIQINS